MKIAHIVPSFYPAVVYGGPTESVYRLCLATAARGAHVRVLTTNANGPDRVLDVPLTTETMVAERLSVRYCPRLGSESVSWSFLTHLSEVIRWADVVHLEAVYSFPTIPTLLAARHLNKPVLWSTRGALARWKNVRKPGLKTFYDRICRLVQKGTLRFHFTSDQEQEGSLWRFPGVQGVVIPNGVECRDLQKVWAPSNVLRLLYLGRLDPIKGIDQLLSGLALLKKRTAISWELTIAGAGGLAYEARLRAQMHTLGIANKVRMIGHVEDEKKEAAFASADVVVIPSHLENFCIVAAEAMARGIPVIVSRGAPWPRLEEKGAGLWVANDPASLAQAVERISVMPLPAMGEKGKAWMKSDFSWDRIAQQMIAQYKEIGGVA